MRFLIVDDNRDLASGLADVLELEGHVTTVVTTASAARGAFRKDGFDYIFLDMKLPDGNGLDLFYEFHALDQKTKIIIMTGFRIEQLLQQVVEDGAVGVLRKPFGMDQVLKALKNTEPKGIVLIADDDPDFAESISSFLSEHGRCSIVARDGQQAVQMAMENQIDVLILDLKLPILCGAEVYLRLKEKGMELPTIIVTGYAAEEAETVDQFRSMSVTNCLFKPFSPEEMLTAIDNLHAIRAGR